MTEGVIEVPIVLRC